MTEVFRKSTSGASVLPAGWFAARFHFARPRLCCSIAVHESQSRLHAELTPTNSPVLLFEGTYTMSFADRPPPTPRYDYNQMLYRLDLDDPALAAAQVPARPPTP